MIYLDVELQNRVIPIFHYALKPAGYLFLGTSEGVSRHSDLFVPFDKQHRIFQSRDNGIARRLRVVIDESSRPVSSIDPAAKQRDSRGQQLRQLVEARVLERYSPAHVVVTHDGEILYFSSGTGRYLEMPRGAPNRQLLELARRELRIELRAILREVSEKGEPASRQVLMLRHETDAGGMISIIAEPLNAPNASEARLMVLFSPAEQDPPPSGIQARTDTQEASAAMERSLRDMRERLQSTIEEYETALEELRSSNEELVSVNEESQSTNEELEASKEEMQSLNEELNTINTELATSVEELDRANSDLKNLYAATQIASVFLDEGLVVRNFTPAAATFFSLRDSDIGRPLTDLASVLDFSELEKQVHQVFTSGEPNEQRLSASRDEHFLVRLMPYLGSDAGVSGVVVTILDVTALARTQEQQKLLIAELNHRVKNMLAVVISIANMIGRTASSSEDLSSKLTDRLHGMARAYALLSEADWTQVSIALLVQAEAASFGKTRIKANGPEVALSPSQTLALGMVTHELATNAAKYGALLNDTGSVLVSWGEDNGVFRMKWEEKDGPDVRMSEHKGFGLVLVEGQIRSLDGEVSIRLEREGLVCELSFPLES